MIAYRRPVRFEDVDAAQIVFFGRYMSYAHEAMEHFFSSLVGGYAGMIMDRRVGVPTVKLEARYLAPLRYGDVVRIEVTTLRLGNRSAVLRYRFIREQDEVLVAELDHTFVTSDLHALRSCEMPADVREALLAHLEAPPASTM
ncbi:MAG: thioesterase family protein [Myxococcales bacterium]|nr:acyl-CoA thioesterase [Polyangiaceae bacterium]MDW8251982.1 thioesterase family protein [Myxococcales bacterium]